MCYKTISYDCGHSEEKYEGRCNDYKRRLRHAIQDTDAGFWRKLFSRPPAIKCEAPPGFSAVWGLCPSCIRGGDADAKVAARRQRKREKEETQVWANIGASPTHSRKRKWTFTCQQCRWEHRKPTSQAREANGGLCCASRNAEDEFCAWENSESYSFPEAEKRHKTNSRSGHHSSSYRTPAPARAFIPLDVPLEDSRQLGWQPRHSRDLEYDLVAGYGNLPGTDSNNLTSRAAAQYEPLYYEAGIDIAQWESMHRTDHGLLPPQHTQPLPTRPSKSKRHVYEDPKPRRKERKPQIASSRGRRHMNQEWPSAFEFHSDSPVSLVDASRNQTRPSGRHGDVSPMDRLFEETMGMWDHPQMNHRF